MDEFSKLLKKKVFVLCFIRTLEQQRNFTMKDKCVSDVCNSDLTLGTMVLISTFFCCRANVAGLLLIALHDNLLYCTE